MGNVQKLPRQIPGLARATPGTSSVNQLYMAAAIAFPRNIFAQCTTSDDVVQSGFYALSGDGDWKAAAHNHLIALERGVNNFRSYVAGGGAHGLLPQQFFYSYRVGGVRLRDWFADLLRGTSVRSVRCMDCAAAEVYTR